MADRYRLEAGRLIVRDDKPIAIINGVLHHGHYMIGGPADLDDFAHEVVEALNFRAEAIDEANRDADEHARALAKRGW